MIEEIRPTVRYESILKKNEYDDSANPLLKAASSLILLFIQLRNNPSAIDVNHLRKKIVIEINVFASQAKATDCSPHLILAAQYCLCTALDEAILLTPWGSQSGWAQHSLLSFIHRETWGGERFFIILEKMADEPKKNFMLLELLYLLLSLGFEGKYYNEDRMLREELQHRLYLLIVGNYPEVSQHLSPDLNIVGNTKLEKIKKISYLRFFASILGILLGIGVIFNTLLYWKAKPFLQNLKDITMAHSAFMAPDQPKIIAEKQSPSHYIHEHKKHHYRKPEENIILPPPVWESQS